MRKSNEHAKASLNRVQQSIRTSLQVRVFGAGIFLATVVLIGAPLWAGRVNTAIVALVASLCSFTAAASVIAYFLKARNYTCHECLSRFALNLIDRDETLIAAVPRQQVRVIATSDSTGGQKNEYSSWVDEKYKVVDRYRCAVCGHEFERKYTKTRRSGFQSSREY